MNDTDKKIKISITGDLGSGKSTVCKLLKDQYNFNVYSIGSIQRTLAKEYNMSINNFNKYMETHTEIDEEIDNALASIGLRNEAMVLDSRLAWHFVPDSFKVYLSVDIETAVYRITHDKRGSVETYSSSDDARNQLLQRKSSENLRYLTKYNVDCSNMNNYDLVIDTSSLSPQDEVNIIMSHFK